MERVARLDLGLELFTCHYTCTRFLYELIVYINIIGTFMHRFVD